MSQPLNEYFAREAGEYLDELDALLARADAPNAAEFFRVARGVRGSAQIAGVHAVARVAEGMENAARALRDGSLQWSDDLGGRARETAADLRVLVAAAERWGTEDDLRAQGAAARWEGLGAGPRRAGAPAGPAGQIYDFLRREMEGVVGELDRALAELQASPTGREPLRMVLRRMRPVRGVAGMDTLTPVLEVLEGIEDTAHQILGRATPVGEDERTLLGAARDALRAAGSALAQGGDVGATPELERFREVRDQADGQGGGAEAGVVPVASLFYSDAGPHVVSSPMAPVPGEGGAEGGEGATLVSDVEGFLRMEATGFLDRAEGLIASLSARPGRFARIARDLAELARGVGDLAVTYGMTVIAGAAEDAAMKIAQAAGPDEARGALLRLRSALPGAAPAPVAVEVEPAVVPSPVEAGEDGIVPIEALVYDPDDALREALGMRPRVSALVGRDGELTAALDELFGLVALGIERRGAPAG
ncbi:MAG TPA: Hpt domain-containing protein [Longimicrobium sp.]|nr:Hpt domain-containing protein [Longimicrobium sp.]